MNCSTSASIMHSSLGSISCPTSETSSLPFLSSSTSSKYSRSKTDRRIQSFHKLLKSTFDHNISSKFTRIMTSVFKKFIETHLTIGICIEGLINFFYPVRFCFFEIPRKLNYKLKLDLSRNFGLVSGLPRLGFVKPEVSDRKKSKNTYLKFLKFI